MSRTDRANSVLAPTVGMRHTIDNRQRLCGTSIPQTGVIFLVQMLNMLSRLVIWLDMYAVSSSPGMLEGAFCGSKSITSRLLLETPYVAM